MLTRFSDALRESERYNPRAADDRAPFGVAQAVFSTSAFSYLATDLFIDGGNILKLTDNVCLTTKELHSKNPTRHADILTHLKSFYGCADVVLLEALPGPVIEHVDMFALPTSGKRIILPDYSLAQEHIDKAWPRMGERERDLTFQAAVIMARNEATLRAKGYEVVFAPALPPRVSQEGEVFYPTMLNALVRSNGVDVCK